MKLEFTPVCETGIRLIDDQHKKFFQYINSAYDALNGTDDEAIATAKNLLKKLRDYADEHFRDEEAYMHDSHDMELVSQIRAHEKFRHDIDAMIAKSDYSKESLKELVDFLARWLYRHILTSDTLIGKEHHGGKYHLTKDFYTEVDFINEQHSNLFEIINRAWDVLDDDLIFDKYDKVVGILNELKVYTQRHFTDEEAHMEKINYDGLEAQKAVHEAFIDKVVNIDLTEIEDMDENQNEYIRELLEFLNDWLINHILRMDTKIPNE